MNADRIKELLNNFDPSEVEKLADKVPVGEYDETTREILTNFRDEDEIPGAHMLLQELSYRIQKAELLKRKK